MSMDGDSEQREDGRAKLDGEIERGSSGERNALDSRSPTGVSSGVE